MPTLPDVSMQPSFFPSQAVIENGEIVAYTAEWHVYHRDTLTSIAEAPNQTLALELCDAAIQKMAELRAPQPIVVDPLQVSPPAGEESGTQAPPQAEGVGPPVGTFPVEQWRHRYSIRANPEAKVGEMVTVSFRIPQNVKDALEARAAWLKEAGDPGIENTTDAMQDAAVCWLLMEGVI